MQTPFCVSTCSCDASGHFAVTLSDCGSDLTGVSDIGVMTFTFAMTPHRNMILSTLLEQGGEIVDSEGMCTRLLMADTGHRTSNALSGVMLAMENAGLIERDKAGRRTYRVGLTSEGRRLAGDLSRGTKIDVPLARPIAHIAPMADVDAELRRLQAKIEMLEQVILNQSEALRIRQ